MGAVVVAILLLLLMYNCSAPTTYQDHEGGPPKCNRGSCWDEKSGHYISADEWNKRQADK